MPKIGKSAPPPFNSRKKNTQPFVSKEKMQKPIDRKPIYLVVEFILFNF